MRQPTTITYNCFACGEKPAYPGVRMGIATIYLCDPCADDPVATRRIIDHRMAQLSKVPLVTHGETK